MSFFESKAGWFQKMVLVSTLVLIAGCFSALPETPGKERPVASDTVETVAPHNETGIKEGAAGQERPGQIPDRQALADYQAELSTPDVGRVEGGEPTVIDTVPNQIPDRQALADYQASLSVGNLGR